MTQNEKDLLLKDLCTRLPYGVIVSTDKGKGHVCDINLTIFGIEIGVNINSIVRDTFSINNVKPYLFPLSSMTDKQNEVYLNTCKYGNISFQTLETFDWLNKNHFDYRGLILMGLAIDTTGKNIY